MLRETYLSVYAPIVQDGKALLAYNSNGAYIGSWGLPGGGVEFGESPAQAIRRELWEEVGVTVEAATLYDVHSIHTEYVNASGERVDFHHISLLYLVTLEIAADAPVLSPDPRERLVWHGLDVLPTLDLSPTARYCFSPR